MLISRFLHSSAILYFTTSIIISYVFGNCKSFFYFFCIFFNFLFILIVFGLARRRNVLAKGYGNGFGLGYTDLAVRKHLFGFD